MKRLISILLFSAICFGEKALGSKATKICTHGAHCMEVIIETENNKWYSFEDRKIIFTAYNHSNEGGHIHLAIDGDTQTNYEKLKQMMNEIQGKIKVTPYTEGNGWDKNSIKHFSTKGGKTWDGYEGAFWFRSEDIKQIDLYQ